MEPAAPQLEWKQLMDYAFVSEFELLKHRHSHSNIIREPWAEPGNREITTKFFKLRGAREEIARCNYEARRLETSVHDEHLHYEETIQRLQHSDPLLATAIQKEFVTRRRVNDAHLVRLEELYALPGFSGIRGCGVRAEEDILVADVTSGGMPEAADADVDEETAEFFTSEDASGDEEEPDEAMQSLLDGLAAVVIERNGIPTHMLTEWDASQA